MVIRAVFNLALLVGVFSLAACQEKPSVSTEPSVSTDVGTSQAAAPPRPTFADMVKINTPLGIVEGAHSPLQFEEGENAELSDVLNAFSSDSDNYSLIVWHQGQVLFEKYFDAHTAETRAESASMHKSVMALLIGAAIDDGFISNVNESVGAYIPEWSGDDRGDITIRDLLEMSSGLKPLSSEGGMQSESVQFMGAGEKARQTMLGMMLADEPGTVFHYQNIVSQLLGHIIESATGKAYQDYLSESIWKPIGASEAKVWFNEPDGFPRTYTGLYAVPRDWLRLGLLVKDNGAWDGKQIVSKDYVSAMTQASRANVNYGWQIWRGERYEPLRYYNEKKEGFAVPSSEFFVVDDLIYFDGFGGQRVYISRSKNLVIVRTGNVKMDWDESKLPNLVISSLP